MLSLVRKRTLQLSFCNGTRRFGIRNVVHAPPRRRSREAVHRSHMGTTTGFEPHLVAPGGHAAARYQTSQRLRPARSNDALSTRRLNLAAAIQRVQVTQRLTSQHASSSLQAKGKVQRNHHVAGSALHLDMGRDSASAAYASAAYAQSRASNEHDADMVAFSDAAMGRLSGIRATINMNRRRGCVHAQYAPGEADSQVSPNLSPSPSPNPSPSPRPRPSPGPIPSPQPNPTNPNPKQRNPWEVVVMVFDPPRSN